MTQDLIDIAVDTIPRTTTIPKRISKPWYDDEVKEAIRNRKRALRKFKSRPTQANLDTFRRVRAEPRRIVRRKMRTTWRDYVSRINSKTPATKVWKMVKKIQGKENSSHIQHLKINGQVLTTHEDISNKLAEQFAQNSSSSNYVPTFQRYQAQAERRRLNFNSNNDEDYNVSFSLEELKSSLKKAHDSAIGPDDIHYQLLKHLPISCLKVLLTIFNFVWEVGTFLTLWRQATVIPIPKPGKDHTDPVNYRPIALTSCLCKTMERMVNDRLVWYLESNLLLTDYQCGFRHQRSTLDHLVRFETYS